MCVVLLQYGPDCRWYPAGLGVFCCVLCVGSEVLGRCVLVYCCVLGLLVRVLRAAFLNGVP